MLSSNLRFVLPLTLNERLSLFPSTTLALQQPNCQIQNGLGVPSWVMHAPTVIMQQEGLLLYMHRTANEVTEPAYQSFVQDRASLQDSAIQGLLQLDRFWRISSRE
jgi:hypothetical protein